MQMGNRGGMEFWKPIRNAIGVGRLRYGDTNSMDMYCNRTDVVS